jgi:SAM-dependent methyltransferase
MLAATGAMCWMGHRRVGPSKELQVREVERSVVDRTDCDFYHVIDFPDGFTPEAQWDIRRGVSAYLGGVPLSGQRVLEIGPASGFISLHMEREGAQVTCVEPPMDSLWDFVPRADVDLPAIRDRFARHIQRVRNSFWYAHRAFGSKVRLFEADAYDLPEALGAFDIGVLGCVLLHCRSPVRMIQSVADRVERTLIITDLYHKDLRDQPTCRLAPDAKNGVFDTWWQFSPRFFVQYLAVIGFPHATVTRHKQYYSVQQRWLELFTVVASRAS